MITVANPIYDVVFKYLMEDERIARTILSALLKADITHVEVRPHEYVSDKRDTLSVFRIDFGATVREADGSEHLVLIELQKTWLPTETLRFRQYLGVQYENPRNIINDETGQHGLPMVCVYLLGHKVGEIEEPVLYVRHRSYDYNGVPVTKGLPDPFVDSLTHDSIIVQIPRLHGQVNNRLDKVLSIFDQTRKDPENQQMLTLDDNQYREDDVEMQRILFTLLKAAANTNIRREMNMEDEYHVVVESRDTEIMMRNRELATANAQLKQKDAQLEQKDAQLEQKDAQLEQKDAQLEQKDAQLEQKDAQLEQKDAFLRSSLQMLMQAGLSTEEIAAQVGMSAESVRRIIEG